MNKQELYTLIDKYLASEATQEEIDLLSRYYNSFQQILQWNEAELGPQSDAEFQMFEQIRVKIRERNKTEPLDRAESFDKEKFVHINKRKKVFAILRISAAAAVFGLLFLGALLWFKEDKKKEISQTKSNTGSYKNDVPPGGDKAILKLADGSIVVLDDAHNGALAQQGNTQIIKLNGKINYNATSKSDALLYNTISTPRGGKYQVELADGTQVWLNAASSLRFPAAFVTKERRVEVTGEAYFEVATNKTMPFIVETSGAEVQVLGTHFNVMAYTDEAVLATTLLEGSVKFLKNNVPSILKPGQQSQLSKSGKVKVINGVDLDEVMAWKNGMFNFQGADIATVARQLERWYEVDVDYDNSIDDHFYAKIPRATKLSEVLKLLELTGKVHFEIDGRKLIVTP